MYNGQKYQGMNSLVTALKADTALIEELKEKVLFLATSNEEGDKIGEEFISQLTENFRPFESGESDD